MEREAEVTLLFCQRDGRSGLVKRRSLDREPSFTGCANGMGDSMAGEYWLEQKGSSVRTTKPDGVPYRVSGMAEITAVPWNGYSIASTFSGCGGSCLGYRMAGFRVLFASEFEPNAAESYQLNHPGTTLDTRDIRAVTSGEILAACSLKEGDLDLLDGSPPCQSFSMAGKREKGWGKVVAHGDGTTQVSDDLFLEFARLLSGLQPKTFVAENVSGLVKGVAKGYFKIILRELRSCGYKVEARLLDAQWLGVPQVRRRIIFIGVRADLAGGHGVKPEFPSPLPYAYSVLDAISDLIDGEFVAEEDTGGQFSAGEFYGPAPTVRASGVGHLKVRPRYDLLPPSRQKAGAYGVSEVRLNKPCPTVTVSSPRNDLAMPYEVQSGARPKRYSSSSRASPTIMAGRSTEMRSKGGERRKFTIAELMRICAFPDDFRLVGSYAQQWARLGNSVPPVMMFHIADAVRGRILDRIRGA